MLGDRVFQLTWQNRKGFIYDLATFGRVGGVFLRRGGVGPHDRRPVAHHEQQDRPGYRFLDPGTFRLTRTISVLNQGQPVKMLNELEYIKGEILANVWQTPFVVRIDPSSGRLLGMIDLTGLLRPGDYDEHTDVLNGIAYDPQGDRVFVTGKDWPWLFEVRLVAR